MLFSTIIAFLPLLAPAFAKIDPVIDKDLTSPWAGKVTTELCESAIKLGRKREIRLMEDGSCAFWGLDVSMFPEEIGSSWGKEICTEKGCNATSTCDYISCSGIERTKWTAPQPEQGEETAEQDDA
ncbi:hypothetical protein EYR41_003550 [Orbilia oligospora]|uniref:Uncharacterized protein n=1 Tax=Orbilia oligospora TaxID=2813651 RepID=A0A8H2E6Z0_ORBOL|nr:hypothetical protein TWF128_009782 [Orbilia oligospora]TGJ71592.1 hypothetical protein EYR41_003550 [Orbilia oligospora]